MERLLFFFSFLSNVWVERKQTDEHSHYFRNLILYFFWTTNASILLLVISCHFSLLSSLPINADIYLRKSHLLLLPRFSIHSLSDRVAKTYVNDKR